MPTLHAVPEQRKSARVDLKALVEVQPDASQSNRLKGNSLNLSDGGICLRLEAALELRARIRLRLFPHAKRPVECAGQVSWVIQRRDLRDSPPFVYDVGVKFIEPPAKLRRMLGVRDCLSLRPTVTERPRQPLLEPVTVNERRYIPHLDRESSSGLWHLTVWVDGVPCFSHRYPTQRESLKAWDTFRADTVKLARRPPRPAPRRAHPKTKKKARSR